MRYSRIGAAILLLSMGSSALSRWEARGDDRPAQEKKQDIMQATKPSDNEILLTQTFAAPRDAVFQALTTPEHITAWMRPTHMTLVSCEVDLCVGGRIRSVFARPNGRRIEVLGMFQTVEPPHRFTYMESYDFSPLKVLVTTSLQQKGDATLFQQTLKYASTKERDEDFPGVTSSSKEAYARLAQYLAAHRK